MKETRIKSKWESESLDKLARKIADEVAKKINKVNRKSAEVAYSKQYVLEKVIYLLEGCV